MGVPLRTSNLGTKIHWRDNTALDDFGDVTDPTLLH